MKTNFDNNEWLHNQFQGVDPAWDRILMSSGSGRSYGESITHPIAAGRSTSASSDFKSAQRQAIAGDVVNKRLKVVTPFDRNVYAVGRVGNKGNFASRESVGAFVKSIDDEVAMVTGSLRSKLSADIWRDGTGAIGASDTNTSNNATAFILADYTDLWYWEVGMQFVFANSASTIRTVTKVDRNNKTINFTPAVSPALAKGVKAHYPGATGQVANTFEGIAAIITNTGLNTVFRGHDRSIDPTRLAGWVINDKAKSSDNPRPILNTIRRACVKISNFYRSVEGKEVNLPNDVYLGSAAWEALSDEYDQKTQLRRVRSSELKTGYLGFEGIEVGVCGKTITAWSCPALNPLTGYLLDTKGWALNWIGQNDKTPVVLHKFQNGGYFDDVSDDAALEFRMQCHPVLRCLTPAVNARLNFTNSATTIRAYTT